MSNPISPLNSSPNMLLVRDSESRASFIESFTQAFEGIRIGQACMDNSIERTAIAQNCLEKAEVLVQEGKFQEALSILQEGIEARPVSRKLQTRLHLKSAQCLMNLNHFEKVQSVLEAAFRVGTKNGDLIGELYNVQANYYNRLSQPIKALEAAERGLAVDPKDPNVLGHLQVRKAAALSRLSRREEAIDACKKGLGEKLTDPNTIAGLYHIYSVLLSSAGLLPEALAAANAGLSARPHDADKKAQLFVVLALISYKQKNIDTAQISLEKALLQQPRDFHVLAKIYLQQSIIYVEKKEWQHAVDAATKGLINCRDPHIQIELFHYQAIALISLGRYLDAFEVINKGIKLNFPSVINASLLYYKAVIYQKFSQYRNALQGVHEGLQHKPTEWVRNRLQTIAIEASIHILNATIDRVKQALFEDNPTEALNHVEQALNSHLTTEVRAKLLFHKIHACYEGDYHGDLIESVGILTNNLGINIRELFSYRHRLKMHYCHVNALILAERPAMALSAFQQDVFQITQYTGALSVRELRILSSMKVLKKRAENMLISRRTCFFDHSEYERIT